MEMKSQMLRAVPQAAGALSAAGKGLCEEIDHFLPE